MNILNKYFIPYIFLLFNNLLSVSAPPFPLEVTQPDNSIIPVYMFGHEYYNWIETEDGYVIKWVENNIKQGWYYSELDQNGKYTTTNIFATYPAPLDLSIPVHLREIEPRLRIISHGETNYYPNNNHFISRTVAGSNLT